MIDGHTQGRISNSELEIKKLEERLVVVEKLVAKLIKHQIPHRDLGEILSRILPDELKEKQ